MVLDRTLLNTQKGSGFLLKTPTVPYDTFFLTRALPEIDVKSKIDSGVYHVCADMLDSNANDDVCCLFTLIQLHIIFVSNFYFYFYFVWLEYRKSIYVDNQSKIKIREQSMFFQSFATMPMLIVFSILTLMSVDAPGQKLFKTE